MKFDFDENKSSTNKKEHGVSFNEAQEIWNDIRAIFNGPANSISEDRWLAIGKIGHGLYTAVYTYRGDTIRLISVRKAREDERAVYEE